MRKLKILLFSADAREPRLGLDEDIRQIREAIRLSEHHDLIELDVRPAARVDDLLQALNDVKPHVVHFSGHGWSGGLELVAADGYGAQVVDVEFLTALFRQFRGNIHLVVFNACASENHARAIAAVVGCGIGMRGDVANGPAITFDKAFYRAIGFKRSVEAAFEQGRLATGAAPERDIPCLVARKNVDPARLVLVPPPQRGSWWKKGAIVGVGVACVIAAVAVFYPRNHDPKCAWDQDGLPELAADSEPPRTAASPLVQAPAGSELETARERQRAGDDDAAFPHFVRAAGAGNTEAMGYLGVAYLCGEGTRRRTERGISWLREAAGRRDARGMIALAFAYQHGIGVKHNRGWMRYWYRMAADSAGSPEAMRRLADSYADDAMWDSAVVWYRRAIGAGSADAMAGLASVYANGPPGLRDPAHASALLDSAARAGSPRGVRADEAPTTAAAPRRVSAEPVTFPDTVYRPPPVDDSGNLVANGGFADRFADWTRTLDGARGRGTNEIVPFADARSGFALHLTFEGPGSLQFVQKVAVAGPDYVFRGTFRASSHEGRMIGFSGTGVAMVMLEYLDANGRFLGTTRLYNYIENPLANTPLVGVPRRENGRNDVHYIDVGNDQLFKDYEVDVRREIEENLLAVVPAQVRTIAIVLYCGATDDGAGAELWASDLSLRPKHS